MRNTWEHPPDWLCSRSPSPSSELSRRSRAPRPVTGGTPAPKIALHFAVSRNGRPVQAFDSYVGHRGHLVALRDGDLSYSHVHPEPEAGVGEIVFDTELPSAGRYRLFLQFKVDGAVHTAPFTVDVMR